MKITDIKTRVVNLDFRNCILVLIETDKGISGIAETVMKRRTLTIESSIHDLRSYLLGKDPTDIEDHWDKLYRDSFWVGGPMHATAISVVDCALWDILAKSCGVPVYKVLGGPTRRRVPAYCHCPSGTRPEHFAQNVKACVQRGYRAIKTTLPLFYGSGKPGERGYSGNDGLLPRTLKETEYLDASTFDRIREFFVAARETGGPDLGIAVDCHGRLNLKGAIRLCRALENLNLMFVEEPVPPENASLLARVQRETSIPIAAGERWATIHGTRQFIEKQAVDILQCDLVNCGGITGMKKIAAIAEAHQIGMAPHNPNGPIATIMNLHFAAAIPNFFILEMIGSESDEELWRDLVGHPPPLEDGHLLLPCGTGFGLELNEAALDNHPCVPCPGLR